MESKRQTILKAISNGGFFTVKFTKKDGSLRTLNGRLNVKKYLKGGTLNYDPKAFNYIIVYDVVSKDYRTVNVETVTELSSNKNKISFAN